MAACEAADTVGESFSLLSTECLFASALAVLHYLTGLAAGVDNRHVVADDGLIGKRILLVRDDRTRRDLLEELRRRLGNDRTAIQTAVLVGGPRPNVISEETIRHA
jgi:hypothetical protein